MTTRREQARQGGFAIVSAIFIVVALAALGAFVAVVATTQHVGSALDLNASRAYYAARAGIEWGIAQTGDSAFCAANPSTTIVPVAGISATVTCVTLAAGDAVESGLGRIHSIASIACNQPSSGNCPGLAGAPNYVERRLTVLIER